MKDEIEFLPRGIFFVETSGEAKFVRKGNWAAGRAGVEARQACSVESAGRRSGLPVYLVLRSPVLSLADNSTCHLAITTPNLQFFTVNITRLLADTPLGR